MRKYIKLFYSDKLLKQVRDSSRKIELNEMFQYLPQLVKGSLENHNKNEKEQIVDCCCRLLCWCRLDQVMRMADNSSSFLIVDLSCNHFFEIPLNSRMNGGNFKNNLKQEVVLVL